MEVHKTVLLNEAIEYLNLAENGVYVDATLGYGGHSVEILKRIKKGFLFAFDQDEHAITYSKEKLKLIGNNFEIISSNFKNLKKELNKKNINKINGILFDLGVSSPQLDDKDRGFSYHQDAKLDMRMDQRADFTAYDLVNNYELKELIRIFFEYGDEKYAKKIALNIIKYRTNKKIETTLELAEIIKEVVPYKDKKEKHPARKVFQAIRIEVNKELEVLEKALRESIELLDNNGRICVITFHSIEDRICKKVFKEYSDLKIELRDLPNIPKKYLPTLKLIKKVKPSNDEIINNKRARSAVLRVAEKIERD